MKHGRSVVQWLGLVFVISMMSLVIYAVTQQDYRQSANDPQIQLATDAVTALNSGTPAVAVVPTATIDPGISLAPFVIVYDQAGNVVATSAKINGASPDLPSGVLTQTEQHGEDRVTWQPTSTIRIAAVAQKFDHGVVVAGRSLSEVEKRESKLELIVAVGWLITVAGVSLLQLIKVSR